MTIQDSDLLKVIAPETIVNGIAYHGDTVVYVDEDELDTLVWRRWMHIADAIDLVLEYKTKREYLRDLVEAKMMAAEIAAYKADDMEWDAFTAQDDEHLEWLAEMAAQDDERPGLQWGE